MQLDAATQPERARAIVLLADKWFNGTVLHFYFYTNRDRDGRSVDGVWKTWVGSTGERDIVRRAFRTWEEVDIGIAFVEVEDRRLADVRIAFEHGDGDWSYLGKELKAMPKTQPTMNFGFTVRGEEGFNTALHEIGHTLGLPHEHQNPNAGIVWNDAVVYHNCSLPPNEWSVQETYDNIIAKIPADDIQGSHWDPDSIMHYEFGPGEIREPADFREGLKPAGGISARDVQWIKRFYPPLPDDPLMDIGLGQPAILDLATGEQRDFLFEPPATRAYTIRTLGDADTYVGLYENRRGIPTLRRQDDDSGVDRNATIRARLTRGNQYMIRARMQYAGSAPARLEVR